MYHFNSVAQSCPTLYDPWTAGRQAFLSITNTWSLSSHPMLSPSVPPFNLSQQQGLFQQVSSFYQVAKELEFQLQHQSFQ